jgi:hypothetical protein
MKVSVAQAADQRFLPALGNGLTGTTLKVDARAHDRVSIRAFAGSKQ